MLNPSLIILRIQILESNSVYLDEVAHNEPPHQDIRCLQIQIFSSLVVKDLKDKSLKRLQASSTLDQLSLVKMQNQRFSQGLYKPLQL